MDDVHEAINRLGELALQIKAERDRLRKDRDALLVVAKAWVEWDEYHGRIYTAHNPPVMNLMSETRRVIQETERP